MRGLVWCTWMVVVGIPLALLGLALNVEWMIVYGAGAVVTAWVGWPVLLLMGEV